jgi:hypothetical protein
VRRQGIPSRSEGTNLKGVNVNIFILEDDPDNTRIPLFKKKLGNHNLFIAKDVTEGKKVLQYMLDESISIDCIFLDHDLGNRVYVDGKDPNVGTRIAEFIKEKNIKSETYFHTMNPVGAENMKAILPEGIIYPFPMLMTALGDGRKHD